MVTWVGKALMFNLVVNDICYCRVDNKYGILVGIVKINFICLKHSIYGQEFYIAKCDKQYLNNKIETIMTHAFIVDLFDFQINNFFSIFSCIESICYRYARIYQRHDIEYSVCTCVRYIYNNNNLHNLYSTIYIFLAL